MTSVLNIREGSVGHVQILECQVIGHQGDSSRVKLAALSRHHYRLLRVAVKAQLLSVRVVILILPVIDRGTVTLLHFGWLGHYL